MKVIDYKEIAPVTMNNDMVKNVAGRVAIGNEDGAKNFCMRVFEMGEHGYTPRHSHDWEHEIFVHAGAGKVFIKSDWHPVSAGSVVFVPANVEHQIRNTTDQTLTFVCLIPSGAPEL